MIVSNRDCIDPALLPPSPQAAYFHGLRVYHQLKVWRSLSNSDLEPQNWGWQMKNKVFAPIKTDEAAWPKVILKIIRSICKGSCDRRCSSWYYMVLHAQICQLILIANWKKKTGILWKHLYSL